jgi:hypothetical protein
VLLSSQLACIRMVTGRYDDGSPGMMYDASAYQLMTGLHGNN